MGAPTSGGLRCSKCGGPFMADDQPAAAGTASDTTQLENVRLENVLRHWPLVEEDWALEAELRGAQRLVSSLKSSGSLAKQPLAIDTPHETTAGWHAGVGSPPAERTSAGRGPAAVGESSRNLGAWATLSLSLAVFACGAVLLGWSLVAKRDDLWTVGMPLALIGQAGLILGLILQLDGLWQTSRKTAEAIHELDDELKHVRQATTLLSTTRTSGAQTFYAHLAEGASPQMLLADLKGQLDLVAQQMAKR